MGRFLPNYAMSAARWLFGFSGEFEKSASVNAPVNAQFHSNIALPQDSPTPKAHISTYMPLFSLQVMGASASAKGMLAPPQFPMSCIL